MWRSLPDDLDLQFAGILVQTVDAGADSDQARWNGHAACLRGRVNTPRQSDGIKRKFPKSHHRMFRTALTFDSFSGVPRTDVPFPGVAFWRSTDPVLQRSYETVRTDKRQFLPHGPQTVYIAEWCAQSPRSA